jgi:hypothetical protein
MTYLLTTWSPPGSSNAARPGRPPRSSRRADAGRRALLREVKATLRDVEDGLLAPLDEEERVVLRGAAPARDERRAGQPCEIAREFAESGSARPARPRRHSARALVGSPDGTTTV